MSFEAFVWAWDQKLAKDEHLIILLTLANIANEQREVYAGQPYIAAMARKEDRTIRRALIAMRDMEPPPITIKARPGFTDVITLNIPEEFTVKRRRPPDGSKKRGRPSTLDRHAESPGHEGGKPPSKESDEPIGRTRGRTSETPNGVFDARGARLPEGWEPDLKTATLLGLSHDEAIAQGDRFRDYWLGVPGVKGRKTDWPATWRNWCRRVAEESPNGRGSPALPNRLDRGANQHTARVDAMVDGARQALAQRRQWTFSG